MGLPLIYQSTPLLAMKKDEIFIMSLDLLLNMRRQKVQRSNDNMLIYAKSLIIQLVTLPDVCNGDILGSNLLLPNYQCTKKGKYELPQYYKQQILLFFHNL